MSDKTYFDLEGDFIGVFAAGGYQLKYLLLRTSDPQQERLQQRDVAIEIPKELRGGMVYKLSPGDRLRCAGIHKKSKFKADSIEKIVREAPPGESRSAQLERVVAPSPATDSRAQILICQQSHCLKNGGKELYSALTEQLNTQNLHDRVSVNCTGCLKLCKQAPNIIVSPVGGAAAMSRASYHQVKVAQIPEIVSQLIGSSDRHHSIDNNFRELG